MSAARLTPAEAKKLGIDVPAGKVRVRRTAAGLYHTVCMTCGEQFNTMASEDRHVDTTRHARFQLVLGPGVPE